LLDEHRPSKEFNFIATIFSVELGRIWLITSRVVEKLEQREFIIVTAPATLATCITSWSHCRILCQNLCRTLRRYNLCRILCWRTARTRTCSFARGLCYSINTVCWTSISLRPLLSLITVIDIKGITPSIRCSGCQFKLRSLIIANIVRTHFPLRFKAI